MIADRDAEFKWEERMKELCKERNSLYEKQKIEKSLKQWEMWGVAVATPVFFSGKLGMKVV